MAEYSTSKAADTPGVSFAFDVIRRNGQFILVTRDTFSSYTTAYLIPDETKESIGDGFIYTTSSVIAESGVVIRCDSASALQSLLSDPILKSSGIDLQLGHVKNVNKNSIGEKGVQELEEELCKLKPTGGRITNVDLAIATKISIPGSKTSVCVRDFIQT